jgi:hypothetical protein
MGVKKVLLVEGEDDKRVFLSLCGQRNIGKLDEIVPQEGVDKLLESFPVRLLESDIGAFGLVLDADTDLSARWAALRSRLFQAGYKNVPDQPASEGTILNPPPNTLLPRFGVWIMPDNQSAGKLEHFIRFLIPSNRGRLLEHAELIVREIPAGERLFSNPDEIKAVIHTWLAWQKEPGKPYGTAITAKFLDPNVPQVDVVVAWLKRLFFPGVPAA